VVEEGRLKSDELSAKGQTQGLSYFEKRFLTMRSVLADKGVISQEDVRTLGERSFELGVMALTRLLLEKGIVTQEALDRNYEKVKARTPMTGARIVARAWADPAFKARLLRDAKGAIMEWNASLLEPNNGETMEAWNVTHLQALENTEKVRNVVVCTLCSCYPMGLLGQPPEWYTKDDYRQRVVKEPRAVMKEWGARVGEDVEIRIYDSSADMRYLVIPVRPRGTERFSEDELADLVTRDSLIGVGDPLSSRK
jgi:nitrile hydratase